MAPLQLVNKISTALDEKQFVLGIFLDLSKAFDTINHSILISKLNKYGLQDVALRWLANYLNNRQQFVHFGFISNRSNLLCEFPKGSCFTLMICQLF